MSKGKFYKIIIFIFVVIILPSCSHDPKQKEKEDYLVRVKKYNYQTNEKVHVRIKGFDDCKLKVEPDKFFFQKKIRLFAEGVKKPKTKTDPTDNPNDDLLHF